MSQQPEQNKTAEEWRDIKGYEGLYQVSDKGRVKILAKTFATGRTMKTMKHIPESIKSPISMPIGYLNVRLSKNGVGKRFTIHQLVANAFLEPIPGSQCVNHKDGNKTNNNVDNLEFATFRQNIQHAFATGLMKGSMKGKFGSNHNRSKQYRHETN